MGSHGLSGEILSCVTKIQSDLETARQILSRLDGLDCHQLDKDGARQLLIKTRTEIKELIEPPGEIARAQGEVHTNLTSPAARKRISANTSISFTIFLYTV